MFAGVGRGRGRRREEGKDQKRRVAQIRAVGATNEGGNKEPPGATDFNGGEWRRGQRPIIVDMSAMLTGSSSDKLRLFLS